LLGQTFGVATAMLVVVGGAAVATASATPPSVKPGESCSGPATAPDGNLWCDMQAGMWLSNGPRANLGQPCALVGDVRLAGGEDLAHCAQTGAGLAWEPGPRD
jgi:hypothetical protein